MNCTFTAHANDLERLTRATRLRRLMPRSGVDFSSNDYLGLAHCTALAQEIKAALDRGVPVGSGGSRLLRGNHEEHISLEEEASRLFGTQGALYFSAGFAANSALLSTLPQRGDLIIADELIHASAHEGLRLSRAERRFARHNDAGHFEECAREWRARTRTGQLWIAVEGLYSMDGDRPPLDELWSIADQYGGVLIVDEAHAVGVLGRLGLGAGERLHGRENVIRLVTCGKALGCEGALVCSSVVVRDFLINRARAFIFSTAPSPLMAAAVRAALKILETQPARRERLWQNVRIAENAMDELGLPSSGSQILPIILGDDGITMSAARRLQEAGFDVRGIRPPTVPAGTSRLRVSITLNVTEADIWGMFRELSTVLASAREFA